MHLKPLGYCAATGPYAVLDNDNRECPAYFSDAAVGQVGFVAARPNAVAVSAAGTPVSVVALLGDGVGASLTFHLPFSRCFQDHRRFRTFN